MDRPSEVIEAKVPDSNIGSSSDRNISLYSSYSEILTDLYPSNNKNPGALVRPAVIAVDTMPDPSQTEIFANSFLPAFNSVFPDWKTPGLASVAFACFEKFSDLFRRASSAPEAKEAPNQASNDDTKAIMTKLPNTAGDAFTALFAKFIKALEKDGVIHNNSGEVKNVKPESNLFTELMQIITAFRALLESSREQLALNDTTNKEAKRDNKEKEEKRIEEEEKKKEEDDEREQEAKTQKPDNQKDSLKEAEQKRLADISKRDEIKFSAQRKQMQQQWKTKEQKKEQTIKKDVASFEKARLRATAWKDKSFGDKLRTIGLSITDRLTGQSGKNNSTQESLGSSKRSERPEGYQPIYVQKGALKDFAALAKRDEDSYVREVNARTAFRQKFNPAAGQYEIEFTKFQQLQSALDARKGTAPVTDAYAQLGMQPAVATDTSTNPPTQKVDVRDGQIEEAYQQKVHDVLVKHGVVHDADGQIDLNKLDKTTYNNVMNDLSSVHQAYKQLGDPPQRQAADQVVVAAAAQQTKLTGTAKVDSTLIDSTRPQNTGMKV